MRKFIQKYYLTTFYIATLLLSILLLPLHFVFKEVGNYSVSFPQLGPTLGLIFIILVFKDKSIIDNIKKHLKFDLKLLKWLIIAIIIPSALVMISGIIMNYYFTPFIFWNGDFSFYALNITAIIIGCIGEELGWRGFLLPNLLKKHTPFISSLIIGILWGVWHLNFTGGVMGFVLYTITTIEMSFLMTWLYQRVKGNLWVMIIWHFGFNLSSHIYLWQRFNLNLFIVEALVFGVLCIIILIFNQVTLFNKQSQE